MSERFDPRLSPDRTARKGLLPRPTVLLAAALVGVLIGTAIDVVRTGGLESWLALRGLAPPYDARGRTVQVGGRDVYIDCRGSGSPTVVLEAGFDSGAGSWGFVLDGVAGFTRVCAWDRPGLGRSQARGTHSAGDAMADLAAALETAGERAPYVLVPHSLGGVYARIFAAAHPEEVVGFVTIDTYDPDLGIEDIQSLPLDFRTRHARQLVSTGEGIAAGEQLDWPTTLAELAAVGPLPQPATLLYVDQHLRLAAEPYEWRVAIIEAWQRLLAERFPNGRIEIVPNTDHVIHAYRPSLVIDRIRAMVERIRFLVGHPA